MELWCRPHPVGPPPGCKAVAKCRAAGEDSSANPGLALTRMKEAMAESLTPTQRLAVEHFEGPLMVLAGPGSGKTRVITHRIARLLQQGVAAEQILALTFTNKAAREMSDRVQRLLGGTRVRVSTFHRFCARLLRRFPDGAGLKENFTILDQSDQVRLVREIMKQEGLDTVFHDPGRVLNRISRARNDLISASEFRRRFGERVGDPLDAVVYEVFGRYEQKVLAQNAVDFDDLLLHVVRMLEDDESLRDQLDQQFRFVLVDEYQDTNLAQYRIVRSISQQYPNLCATGDPDQSIYGWRGARPDNIACFERDFPSVRVVSLDQNFRSTQSIVRCADQLISRNYRPHRGPLVTSNPEGSTVRLVVFENQDEEAAGIAREIAERVAEGDRCFSDFAIFYRVNALSRTLETALSRERIPFQVAAGFSFYERAEIRDLISYLRLIENQADDSALLRIINRPIRGIGARSVQRLSDYAQKHGISLFEAISQSDRISELTARSRRPLKAFADLIGRLNHQSADGHVAPVLERLIVEIDYLSLWKEASDEVDVDRLANVHELISAARQFDAAGEQPDSDPPSLQGFLELACLSSEVDNLDEEQGVVTLMTMHAAKGLEFPAVFIVGVENGLIPHERAVRNGDPASFEEERRLLFVGVTRAMQELTMTQTMERTFRGSRRSTISSPFLAEIEDVIERSCDAARSGDDGFSEAPMMPEEPDTRLQEARRRFQIAQSLPQRPLLITAADLETRQQAGAGGEIAGEPTFTMGMHVRHPRFGRGVITAVSPASRRSTVTVRFENSAHSETFVAGKCPLQPVGIQNR